MTQPRIRHAFTVVELLVAVAVISILLALVLPAVQAARESARKTTCLNNLHQLGVALASYETARGHYPSSWMASTPIHNGRTSGWSSQVQLLPFLDRQDLYSQIDLDKQYGQVFLPTGAPIGTTRMAELICPSETGDRHCEVNDKPCHYPLNYGANLGVWFVYDPVIDKGGEGAFFPSSKLKPKSFTDGLSKTAAFAEVKAWTPYFRNAARYQPAVPEPQDINKLGGQFQANTGHTRWVDGRSQSTGVTATFTPNTFVPSIVDGIEYDVDWNNQCEGLSPDVSTYSAVTSRSYHAGGVNVIRMDVSATYIPDEIDPIAWRTMFTRRSGDGVQQKVR